MIRLEIKQSQAIPVEPVVPVAVAGERAVQALAFSIVIVPGRGNFVLATDSLWTAALEHENNLAERLAAGNAFVAVNRQVYVLGTTSYADGRTLYQCAAITLPVK